MASAVLRTAVEVQACTDYNTLFRANSLASKALDYYMKHIGMDYLSGGLSAARARGDQPAPADGQVTSHGLRRRGPRHARRT